MNLKNNSLIIAFLGPDGSGKSTVINLLKQRKELSFSFKRIEYFHLKPGLLDSKKNKNIKTNPHQKPYYRGIKAYLKLLYFLLDYILGYIFKILPLKLKSSLILFDRYYDDIYIDPKRYRYGGNLKLAKILRFLIPKPDIYIILTTDPKIIYERKKEIDFKELEKQICEYEKLIDNIKFFKIDASLPPKEIVNIIIEMIKSHGNK